MTARQQIAVVMERSGIVDSPFVRHLLTRDGSKVEIWRRTCKCERDCNCWELAAMREATDEDRAAYAVASAPPQRQAHPAAAVPEEDPIRRIADGLKRARPDLWRGLTAEPSGAGGET